MAFFSVMYLSAVRKWIGYLTVPNLTFFLTGQGENDESFGAEFAFSEHSKELIVGEIFVRVYNEQPTFPLEVSAFKYSRRFFVFFS